jgi:poly(hydroxyalkanoate) depolymerase family esterase
MSDDASDHGDERGLAAVLGAAFRSVSSLSRNRRAVEASKLAREALARLDARASAASVPREMPSLNAADGEVGSPPLFPSGPAARVAKARPRQPLGTVVERLRAEARLPPLGGLAPSRPQGRPSLRVPEDAAYLTRSHSAKAGSRDYRLYVPAAAAGRARGLVVMLHGCTQTPDDFAAGTGMNALAEEHGFIVAYPWQPTSANQSGCWNWFRAEDQLRERGEPSILAGLTRALVREFDIDSGSVFVAGLSAGGAMAATLSATYPDLYRAAGIHSGLAHGAATDLVSAFAAMRGTPAGALRSGHGSGHASGHASGHGRVAAASSASPRTIVFHGTADQTVHPSNADVIFASARVAWNGAAETMQRGRSPGGLAYVRKVLVDSDGRPQLEQWTIDGLGHAWSGGSPDGSYTDRLGPDASREMVRFFLADEA